MTKPRHAPSTPSISPQVAASSTSTTAISKASHIPFTSSHPSWAALQRERAGLPISASRQAIVDAIKQHDTVILVGETASGKSTQIPQFLHEAGLSSGGIIACTQPRRVAAVSLAARVALEVAPAPSAPPAPSIVAHSIRFDDASTAHTRIKYITDGMLLREALLSPLLPAYSVVILDEAHERSVNTDVLCYLLSTIQARRSLKVVVMSATLDTDVFARYFRAPVLRVEGRQYPVDVLYAAEAQDDYVDAAVTTALQVHLHEADGDVLVFLPGQEDIESAIALLEEKLPLLPSACPPYLPLPLYAALSHEQQMAVFRPCAQRKVIVATNIAETSLTIPGVRYVVDSGLAKVKTAHPSLPLALLAVQEISQAEAWQRSGRAGRERAGKAYRLYTEATYERFRREREPEMRNAELSGLVLQLKGLGVHDILKVRWLTEPSRDSLRWALERLLGLGALEVDGGLSADGKAMVSLPVDVGCARALLMSAKDEWACAEEMLTIVSMLTVGSVFTHTSERGAQGTAAVRRLWSSDEGDHMVLLRVWRDWLKHKTSAGWCDEWRVQRRSLVKVEQVRLQMAAMLGRLHLPVLSASDEVVRRCLAFAFHLRIARREPAAAATASPAYVTLFDAQRVWIHPASTLRGRGCEYVLYHELVLTKRPYMRDCLRVEADWVKAMQDADAAADVSNARQAVSDAVMNRLAGSTSHSNAAVKRDRDDAPKTSFVIPKRPRVIIAPSLRR